MTKPDFEFDAGTARLESHKLKRGLYQDKAFIEGARYQHKIDLEKHEAVVAKLKGEQVKNIKLMLNQSQELNGKYLTEIATLKEAIIKANNHSKAYAVHGLDMFAHSDFRELANKLERMK